MKGSHHRRVAPLHHARNASGAASIGARRLQLHQHLVALHRAVDLRRRNEDVLVDARTLIGIGPHKAIAVAMQIEPPGHQVVACPRGCARNAPVLAVDLRQLSPCRQPLQLLQQQTPLAPSAQAQLAHQLLVACLTARRARNARYQIAIRHLTQRYTQRRGARRLPSLPLRRATSCRPAPQLGQRCSSSSCPSAGCRSTHPPACCRPTRRPP